MTRWASLLSVFLNLPCSASEKVSCMPELVLDFRHRANLFLSLFQKIPLGAGFGSIRNSKVAHKALVIDCNQREPSLCLKVTLETGNFTISRISENVGWFMLDCTFPKIDIWCAINTQTLDMNCSCKTSGNAKSLHIVLSVIRRTDPVYA